MSSRRRVQRALCAAVAAALLGAATPPALADVLISDFEANTGGVQTWNNPASLVADPTGDSTYMLKLDATGPDWNRWIWANWSNGAISQGNANNHLTLEFDAYFPSTLWTNGTAQVWMDWEGAGGAQTTPQQTVTVTPDTKQHVVIDYSALLPITAQGSDGWFDLDLFIAPGAAPVFPQSVYIDNLKLVSLPPPPPNDGTWDATMSGGWGVAGNWAGGVIGYGTANSATFPAPAAPQTVTTDIGVTVGVLNLNGSGANGYTIDGIREVAIGTGASFNVNGGTHVINAPLNIPDGVIANVSGGGIVTLNNPVHNSYGGLTKTGDGTLVARKLVNFSLTVEGGTLTLLPGNGQAYNWLYAVTLAEGATFNMNDNQLRTNGVYGNGTVNVGAGGVLTTGEYGGYGFFGTLTGAGDVVVGWQESLGGSAPASSTSTWAGTVSYTGNTLLSNGSTLVLETSMTSSPSITLSPSESTGAVLQIAPGAGSGRVLKTASLSVGSSSKIDVGDNKMIVSGGDVGSASGNVYTGLTGLVQSGRGDGSWNGSGIVTSMPDAATGLTSLAIATADGAGYAGGTFGGISVTSGDVLIMYTYAGDANLDGFISGDDYSAIDFASGTPGASGWANGDFNYDGFISGDDYSTIDFNLVAQGAPFPTNPSPGGAAVAVPEPCGATLLLLFAAASAKRQRCRRASGIR